MKKINLKWAKKPQIWLSTSAIGLSVHQLLILPESTRSELLYSYSLMIPSLIAIGVFVGISLTKKIIYPSLIHLLEVRTTRKIRWEETN